MGFLDSLGNWFKKELDIGQPASTPAPQPSVSPHPQSLLGINTQPNQNQPSFNITAPPSPNPVTINPPAPTPPVQAPPVHTNFFNPFFHQLNQIGNGAVSDLKDIGDLGSLGVANLTGNKEAANNARNAIGNNNANLDTKNFATNLGGLSQDVGVTPAAKAFVNTGAGAATNIVNGLTGQNQTSQQAIGGGPLGGLTNWASDNGTVNEGTARNLAGNAINTGINLLTLGKGQAIDKAAEGVIGKALPALADSGLGRAAQRLGGSEVVAGLYGAGQGASQAAQNANNIKEAGTDIGKGIVQNLPFGVLGVLPNAAHGVIDTANKVAESTPAIINQTRQLVADQSGHLGFNGVADNHPAVLQLNDHLDTLNKLRDNMTKNGLDEHNPAMVNNAKAYQATLDELNNTRNAITQGGYAKIPGTSEPIKPVVDPLAQLKQEALKYKSADEFIKNHATVHATDANIKGKIRTSNGWYGKGVYTTTDFENAIGRKGSSNQYFVPKTNDKLLKIEAIGPGGKGGITPKQVEEAKAQGYKGLEITHPNGKRTWYNYFDEQQPYTKQQLTDLYNQAHAEAKPVAPQVGRTDNIVYHGKSVGGGETGDRYGKGLYVTTDKNRANGYSKSGAVDEYSLDGLKLANLDDKVDSKIVDTLKREINDSIKNGDNYYKDAIRMSVGKKTFSKTDIVSARKFVDEKRAMATKLGLGEDSMPTIKKNSSGDFTITYIDDTLESLKNIDGNRLFRSLPSPTAQSLFTSAGFDGVSYRGIDGDIESVVYNSKLNKPTPAPQVETPAVQPPVTKPDRSFILSETKPMPDGSKIVIKAGRDPNTGQTIKWEERVNKSTDKPINISKPKTGDDLNDPQTYADTFGTSLNEAQQALKQIKEQKNPENNIKITRLPETDTEKAQRIQLSQPKPKTAEENTAANPVKVKLPQVNEGNYEQAKTNPQIVANTIRVRGDRAANAVDKVFKNSSDLNSLAKLVENPTGRMSVAQHDLVTKIKDLFNTSHAISQELGGNTNYLNNFFSHNSIWDLSNKEDKARFDALAQKQGSIDPFEFNGIDRQPRVFKSIEEGEKAGFKVRSDIKPSDFIREYAQRVSFALKQEALKQAVERADSIEPNKTNILNLGQGKGLPISSKAANEFRGYQAHTPSEIKAIKGLRTLNSGAKSAILSLGQFHPINISLLRAAPTLAIPKPSMLLYKNAETGKIGIDPTMGAHPVRAVKGAYGTFRPLLPGGKTFAEKRLSEAVNSGLADDLNRINMPLSTEGYDAEGSFLKGGLGHSKVFGQQMPMMHLQVGESILNDLRKRGIDLNSDAAKAAGEAGNNLMGFVNSEIQKIPPKLNQGLSDLLLAKQFTHSKFSQLRNATEGGVGGSYARANVAANVVAATAVIAGIGYLVNQKSDNLNDILLKALVDPRVSTPSKDNKGNNIALRLPGTDTSDIAKLLGIKLIRKADGHLGVSWNIQNLPTTVADYARARLSPIASTAVKIETNSTYAGKPMFDPNAPAGIKVQQAGTSIATGLLPIGLQGLPYVNAVEKHLPNGVQEVLNAQKPSTNPLLKSIGSSFGLTPTTDTLSGKGLQSSQYFDALNQAGSGLNRQEKDAFDLVTGGKKNPVTGQYEITPTVFDSTAKANALLQNPNVLNHLTAMNRQLANEGNKVDPFFTTLSSEQQQDYLAHQLVNKNNTQQLTVDNERYKDWLPQFDQARAEWYNTLPPSDPNKPKNPIQPPQLTQNVSQLFNQADNISDPQLKSQFYAAHPELTAYEQEHAKYINQLLVAERLTPLKPVPTADAQTSSFMSTYFNADSATRQAMKASNPNLYLNMNTYLQNMSEYQVAKNGALDQLQGQQPNQKLLKGIQSLATYDLVKNPDGTLGLKYSNPSAGNTSYGGTAVPQAGAVSASGSGSSKHKKIYMKNKRIKMRKAHIRPPHIKPIFAYNKTYKGPLKISRPNKVNEQQLA